MRMRGMICVLLSLGLMVGGMVMIGCEQHVGYEHQAAQTGQRGGLGYGGSGLQPPHPAMQPRADVQRMGRQGVAEPGAAANVPLVRGGRLIPAPEGVAEPGAAANVPLPGWRDTDEIWVIEKGERVAAAPAEQMPRTGTLLAQVPGEEAPVGFPLKHTDVQADILGYVATVNVTQQYHNPYAEKIEAVYVFPLPSNAAVSDFVMTIGERRIRGIIREREEAEKIYLDARAQGYTASLLTQERPNVFTQKVANIEPGKQIDVNIKYFHTLAYVDGWYEWVFPMVVGPRFNPPGFTEGIGAISTGLPGRSGQATEVQYLKPGQERSGHDISLAVRLDVGVDIEEIDSRNHKIDLQTPEHGLATITLHRDDSIPNKDFVLRYRVAGDRLKSAVMAQRHSAEEGYFTLMLFPPQTIDDLPRKPLELFFTLDVSGSMHGKPIEQSKAAIRYALQNMDAGDTFQVIRFAGNADQLFDTPQPVTRENIRRALQHIDNTSAGGGTMMIEGIRRSLNHQYDDNRLRFVCFMTDGFIGNESEILREIHNLRGPSRIFSFGVGSSTNRFLLDHMAKFGFGTVAYLGLNDRAENVMEPFFNRIAHPAMTNITIDWNGLEVQDVYPRRIPDLFVGQPVILTGRFRGTGETTILVSGNIGGRIETMRIPIRLDDQTPAHGGLRPVWARAKLEDLADRAIYEQNPDLPSEVKQIALEYGLMSPYTAFVAVDSSHRTAGETGTTLVVPVAMPEGVSYQTTVTE